LRSKTEREARRSSDELRCRQHDERSEEWWRRRELNPRPKARRHETLHAYPLLLSRAQREEAAKNRRVTRLGISHPRTPSRHPGASLFNGIRPPTTRRGQGERHSLIKLRERTVNPQLTDVPSDLRVNGARHASRDLEPPSKPNSPPLGVTDGRLTLLSLPGSSVAGSVLLSSYSAGAVAQKGRY
jgi:hypothetical protein